jgi:hypothetical protein
MSAIIVNLFLLLSALLSALTGVSTGARVAEPATISRSVATAAPVSAAAVRAEARIAPRWPGLRTLATSNTTILADASFAATAALTALLTNRRRE